MFSCRTSPTDLLYMRDLFSLEFEAAKLSICARHPTFIYCSLGIGRSKHNSKPEMKVKYLEP